MSGKKDQDEPTMEEILASIRRIISEEGEQGPSAPAPRPSLAVSQDVNEDDVLELTEVLEDDGEDSYDADRFDVEDEPFDAGDDFEVAAAESEDAFVFEPQEADAEEIAAPEPEFETTMAVEPEPEIEPEPEPEPESASEPLAVQPPSRREPASLDDAIDVVDPADEQEAIVSEPGADAVRASFGQLSDLMVAGYAGADKTLEGMVREMLKPMLKTWLDQNLPQIVERAVAREIARLARVKKP